MRGLPTPPGLVRVRLRLADSAALPPGDLWTEPPLVLRRAAGREVLGLGAEADVLAFVLAAPDVTVLGPPRLRREVAARSLRQYLAHIEVGHAN